MNAQKKAAGLGAGEAAQHNIIKPYCSDPTPKTQALLRAMSRRIWIAQYSLEGSRQIHASAGRLVSEIMCCMGLVLLRILGARL